MKLWLIKVGKLDACIRPLFANSVIYTYIASYCTYVRPVIVKSMPCYCVLACIGAQIMYT